jgi:hypothetical protein
MPSLRRLVITSLNPVNRRNCIMMSLKGCNISIFIAAFLIMCCYGFMHRYAANLLGQISAKQKPNKEKNDSIRFLFFATLLIFISHFVVFQYEIECRKKLILIFIYREHELEISHSKIFLNK